jgi:hypothetical protein
MLYRIVHAPRFSFWTIATPGEEEVLETSTATRDMENLTFSDG